MEFPRSGNGLSFLAPCRSRRLLITADCDGSNGAHLRL
jgi:hypothetical protein